MNKILIIATALAFVSSCSTNTVKQAQVSAFKAYADAYSQTPVNINDVFTKTKNADPEFAITMSNNFIKRTLETQATHKWISLSKMSDSKIKISSIKNIKFTNQGYAEITFSGKVKFTKFFTDHEFELNSSTVATGFSKAKSGQPNKLKIIPLSLDIVSFTPEENASAANYLKSKAINHPGANLPVPYTSTAHGKYYPYLYINSKGVNAELY